MSEPKKYELAYLLSPAVPEDEVLVVAGSLVKIIEDSNGLIRHQETPAKRRLSYLVKKEQNAYFSWITFSTSPENLAAIEKGIKGAQNLLRHMLVEEEEIPPQPIRTYIPRPAPTRVKPPAPTPTAAGEQKPEEKLDLEELDKKLEEILGK